MTESLKCTKCGKVKPICCASGRFINRPEWNHQPQYQYCHKCCPSTHETTSNQDGR